MTPPLFISAAALTDRGLIRKRNEDAYAIEPLIGCYLVCDGMGGHAAGDIASLLAADSICSYLRDTLNRPDSPSSAPSDESLSSITNRLGGAILHANRVIHREALQHPSCAGMGTTVVATLIRRQVASVAHVGDSRLYLVRDQRLDCLTTDHSIEVDRNHLDLGDGDRIDGHSRSSLLTRAVGVADSVEVELSEAPLMPGDVLLLCSDGLTREVTPNAILETVIQRKTPQSIAEQLMSLAKAAGGRDNITVLILSVHAGTAPTLWDRVRQCVGRHIMPMTISKENAHA